MPDRGKLAACAALLQAREEADEFSGAALIAQDGIPLMEWAYGYSCKGFGIHNRIDTLFNIGSLTKMFTAVSIMQMVERGNLRLDDVVSKFLPEYPREVGDQVALHHLLTHTSGFGSYWNTSFEAVRTSLRTVSEYLPLVLADPPAFGPGERFRYSNSGYVLLGAIIERVSGMSYDDYLCQHLFDPAGMVNTSAPQLDVDVPNRAVGYIRDSPEGNGDGRYPRTNVLVSPAKGSPAGGSYSTVFDLLRFAEALRGYQLLSAEFTDMLLQPRVPMGPSGTAWYAYGFGCHIVDGVHIVGHNGGAPGVGAQLDMYRETGYTVVLLSNYDASVSMKVVGQIRSYLTGG